MASSSKCVEMMTHQHSPPTTVTTFGPAGTPQNLREAGENILDKFCNSYPDTEAHSLLPKFFGDNITEIMEPRENLSRREQDRFIGRLINQVGEGHELVVFNIFVRLIRQKNLSPTLLVMRTFEMDTRNPMNLKRNGLQSLLPNINLKSVNTEAENDFLVLVQNLGVVCIEAKGSTKDSMVHSAEKQLTNINKIVQSIMKAMTKDEKRIIPTVRLIIVPDHTEKTPNDPTRHGSFFVFNDKCENFEDEWENIVNRLTQIKSDNPFTPAEYKELCQILTGLWSAKVVCVTHPGTRSYELKQEEASISHVRQLEKIDKIVDTSNIRNEDHFKFEEEKQNPFTQTVKTNESDIFHLCNGLKLCYLTPAQKELFSYQKQAIVRSVAGCGKTLLILFKTLELVNDPELSCLILILAPVPHTIRIKSVLQSNSVSVDMIEEFPPPLTSSKVFIMDVKMFFKVKRNKLMSYDISGYHLFIDDLQHLSFIDNNDYDGTSFFDVGDFTEKTYNKCVEYNTHLWIMLDVTQGDLSDDDDGKYSTSLFLTREKHPRTYNIPTVTIIHVMRNTHHIMKLTNEARNEYVTDMDVSSVTVPSAEVGHKVTSSKPTFHKLKRYTDKKLAVPFILSRLCEVLETIITPSYSLPLSNVAIIYDSEDYFEPYKDDFVSRLTVEFGTTPQTIEEHLISNNTTDIVMDKSEHIMSFEVPVVVFIRCVGGGDYASQYYYTIGTRARVSLTIIDVVVHKPPHTYENMDVVLWKPDGNGNFTKYYDSDSK